MPHSCSGCLRLARHPPPRCRHRKDAAATIGVQSGWQQRLSGDTLIRSTYHGDPDFGPFVNSIAMSDAAKSRSGQPRLPARAATAPGTATPDDALTTLCAEALLRADSLLPPCDTGLAQQFRSWPPRKRPAKLLAGLRAMASVSLRQPFAKSLAKSPARRHTPCARRRGQAAEGTRLLNEHTWKRVSWVRIPSSPPFFHLNNCFIYHFWELSFRAPHTDPHGRSGGGAPMSIDTLMRASENRSSPS